jgi:hypothetical protein
VKTGVGREHTVLTGYNIVQQLDGIPFIKYPLLQEIEHKKKEHYDM